MANGMDFEVWGPASVRHPDSYMLNHSAIEQKLQECQVGQQYQFKLYGDSAYFDDEYMVTGGGRGMSSVRETIEWGYKDLKTYWKYCDYRHCLKLRQQPLAKIFFVCILLRNIHCTMYESQVSGFFNFPAPEFETWISQGPRAKPLPNDIIFSADYNGVNNAVEDESSSDEE